MGHAKPVAQNLLADLPTDVDAVPSQPMSPPKPKRIKKAQPKARAVEAEDSWPISKLAESKKTSSASAKRSAETQPSESTQSKKPRSASATTSGSKKSDVPWAPKLTLEDRPIMSTESADDINAIQHAHSFSMQSFENRQRVVDMKREISALKKDSKSFESKMKKLEDQAEAATKAQQIDEEKAESAEAIRKVAEAEKEEFKSKMAQAEKELQKALATKKTEIEEADEKAYAQDDSPLRNAEAVPLPFPPNQAGEESESEPEANDEDNDDGDALVRKPKDGEDEEFVKEATLEQASPDVPPTDDNLNRTLAEIDAEIMAEKAAEVAFQESIEVQIQIAPDAEES
ncbi:otolith matrix protein OMM-64-like [Camellia sinensis]|uniref:otolith matrix protein OMM-64-like n=1 Tax=Camellia sinensis TaxID=4442 RepID=UPI001035CF4E|nr:otolith matrix protein OMM-64-like [Camellia sinensis]